ncbi:MAG: hypothetical protein HYS43_00890 [Candidatus Liptonbacteria bacterium]|nr:hypothetical protein [Candidatus Liptonbacteria bacterium]
MVNRIARQIVYGIGYLAVFGITGLFIFFAFRSAPSCFDGRQNQGERGIDCGGPCIDCAIGTLRPVRAGDAAWIPTADHIVFAATMENTNAAFGVLAIGYTFTAFGDANTELITVSGTSFLYPNEKKTVVEAVAEKRRPAIRRVAVTLGEPAWVRAESFARPQFSLGAVSIESDEKKNETIARGTIRNEEAGAYGIVGITALLYDARGALAGASKTQIALAGLETKEFTVHFPFVRDIDPALTAVSYEAKR